MKKGQGTFEYVLLLAGVLLIVVLAIVLLRGGIFGGGAKDVQLQACARQLAQGTACYKTDGSGQIDCNAVPVNWPDACLAYNNAYDPDLAKCGDAFASTGCTTSIGGGSQFGVGVTPGIAFPSPSPTNETSALEVSSDPSNASVFLDGVFRGYSRVIISPIITGNHVVLVTKYGYQNNSQTIYIHPTPVGISRVFVTLQQMPVGSLSVSSIPTNASVFLDGVFRGYTYLLLTGIFNGSHALVITKPDYYGYNTTVNILPEQTTAVSATLQPLPYGSLSVSSNPGNSSVYLDGNIFGGYTLVVLNSIPVGYHNVTITHDSYYNHTGTVYITAGANTNYSATLTPLPAGNLNVTSSPSNSSVYVDSSFRGFTPLFVSGLSAGYHGLVLSHEGYQNYSDGSVYISSGQTRNYSATLQYLYLGALNITSTPSSSSVFLDSVFRGYTPLIVNGLSVGYHTLVLSHEGYQNLTDNSVYVSLNQTRNYSATLQYLPLGALSVTSNPSSSSVYIDSALRGYTPLFVNGLSVGYHNLTLTHIGYQNYSDNSVYISLNQTRNYSATLSYLPLGALSVTSNPSNGSVYLDTVFRGYTPLLITEVPIGYRNLTLTHIGYKYYNNPSIYISTNSTSNFSVAFEYLPLGALNITSVPTGASVYLDNVSRGYTNLFLIEIPIGYHNLVISKLNYKNYTNPSLYITTNQTTNISTTLQPSPWPGPSLGAK